MEIHFHRSRVCLCYTGFALFDKCRLKSALYTIQYWRSGILQEQGKVHFVMERSCK